MLNMQCRLCSSTTALISLFSGKCRKNRDYIRKLIAVTTGIQFQKSDICKCICFACTIQIYNFYIFRTQSIENEKKLQVCVENIENRRSHKIDAINLDDIVLPDVEELKETLAPWFISKQKYCESESNEASLNNITSDDSNHDCTQKPTLIESSTQCELVQPTEISTQCESHNLEATTQTNFIETKTKKIQCGDTQWRLGVGSKEFGTQTYTVNSNSSRKKLNKLTQYEYISVENCTQTEIPRTESKECSTEACVNCSKKIQCDLYTLEKHVTPNKLVKSSTRSTKNNKKLLNTSNALTTSAEEYIDPTTELTKTCRCNVLKFEVDTQTEVCVAKSIEIQCELMNVNQTEDNSSYSFVTNVAAGKTNNSEQYMYKETESELTRLNRDEKTPNFEHNRLTSNDKKCAIQHYTRFATSNCLQIQKGSSKRSSKKCLVKSEDSATQTEITCMGNLDSKDYIKFDLSGKLLKENLETQKIENQTIFTEKINKETQCNLPIIQGYSTRRSLSSNTNKTESTMLKKNNENATRMEPKTKHETKESFTQTDVREDICLRRCNKKTQCNLYTSQKHNTRGLLKANSINIEDRSLKKCIEKSIESATQTEVTCMGDHTNELIPKNFGQTDVSKTLHVDIKHEVQTPPALSPVKCLSINVDSSKNETLLSPGLDYVSPRLSNLLAIKDKIQHVIICPECDTTVYSNSEYKLHKKSHMQCNFCKMKFKSLKRTKLHIEFNCKVQRLIKMVPVVTLVRLENLTDIQSKYPECIESLKKYDKKLLSNEEKKDVKKVFRIRSRSVSYIDSVISCSACRGSISVLNKVSIGVDKSIQVNFILDTDFISPLKHLGTKRDLMDSTNSDGSMLKRMKLSPEVNS